MMQPQMMMRAMRTCTVTMAFSLDANIAASTRAGGLPHSLALLADTAGSTIRSVSLKGGTDGRIGGPNRVPTGPKG